MMNTTRASVMTESRSENELTPESSRKLAKTILGENRSARDIAEDLLLMSKMAFCSITAEAVKEKEDKERFKVAANFVNNLILLAKEDISSQHSIESKTKAIKKWADIMNESLRLKDFQAAFSIFCSIMPIVAPLKSAPIKIQKMLSKAVNLFGEMGGKLNPGIFRPYINKKEVCVPMAATYLASLERAGEKFDDEAKEEGTRKTRELLVGEIKTMQKIITEHPDTALIDRKDIFDIFQKMTGTKTEVQGQDLERKEFLKALGEIVGAESIAALEEDEVSPAELYWRQTTISGVLPNGIRKMQEILLKTNSTDSEKCAAILKIVNERISKKPSLFSHRDPVTETLYAYTRDRLLGGVKSGSFEHISESYKKKIKDNYDHQLALTGKKTGNACLI